MRVLVGLIAALAFATISAQSGEAQTPATQPTPTGFESYAAQLIELRLTTQKRIDKGNGIADAAAKFRKWIASPRTGAITDAEKVILAKPADAVAQREALKAWLREYPNQRKLVASGALNAVVGNATLDALRRAVSDFRRATGSTDAGPPSEAESYELNAAEAEIDGFAKIDGILNKKTGLQVFLPLGLVKADFDEAGDGSWTSHSSTDRKFKVDHFRIPLKSLTAIQLARLLIEKRRELEFERLDLRGDGFSIDALATARAGGGREYASFGAREIGGYIQGYGFRVDLEPSESLTIPNIRVPNPGAEKAGEEIAARIASDKKNWRPVVKVIRNLLASKQLESESLEPISRASCAKIETRRATKTKVVKILYATDRKPDLPAAFANPVDLARLYSSDLDPQLHIGCIEVEVGPRPEVELPGVVAAGFDKFFGRILQPTAVRAMNVQQLQSIDFAKEKRFVLRGDEVSGNEKALLFIHGYNNSFKDAVERAARLAAASEYYGQVYLFSWPSKQWFLEYAADMDYAEQAEVHLTSFLKAIMSSGDLIGLDIVAHSMGSQILLRTLDSLRPQLDRRLGADPFDNVRFGQIIFAAPDVSSVVFAQKVVPFTYFADRVTVYASENDGVLDFSGWVRDGVPRAGFVDKKEPINVNGVHVIDITRTVVPRYLAKRVVGSYHGAFVEDEAVLQDIADILSPDASKAQRDFPLVRAAKKGRLAKFQEQYYQDQKTQKYWRLIPVPASTPVARSIGTPP